MNYDNNVRRRRLEYWWGLTGMIVELLATLSMAMVIQIEETHSRVWLVIESSPNIEDNWDFLQSMWCGWREMIDNENENGNENGMEINVNGMVMEW